MSTTTENTDISNNRRLLYNVDQFLPREIPAIIPTINSENVEPKPRRKFFYQISIHSGNQYPDKNIQPSFFWLMNQQHFVDNNFTIESPRLLIFEGNCYCCGADGHSQSYCPIKQCNYCRFFGHGEKVCPEKNLSFELLTHQEEKQY